ncbi:MAG: TolC family protein [Bacteroidales bacterium]|nr:TolC family protein [Bacteroidales bacterium]
MQNLGYGWNYGGTQLSHEPFNTQNNIASSMGIDAKLELFNGLYHYHAINKGFYDKQAVSMDLEYQKNLLTLDIVYAFLNVLLDKELFNAQQIQISFTRDIQTKLEYQYEQGSIPKLTILENKAQLAQEQAKLTEIESNGKYNLLLLAHLLKIETTDSFDIIAPVNPLVNAEVSFLSANDIFNTNCETRPEIAAVKFRIESMQSEHYLLLGKIYPALSAQVTSANNYVKSDINSTSQNLYLGLLLQVPLFNKMETKNHLKINKNDISIKKNEYEIEKQRYREIIEKAYTNAISGYAKLKANKNTFDATSETYEFAKERYNCGALSYFDTNELKTKLQWPNLII